MKKVILVDDEEDLNFFIESIFEDLKLDFQIFQNAEEALDFINNGGKYDLILSDFNLPGKSGFDILQCSKNVNPDLPVIIMSGANISHYPYFQDFMEKHNNLSYLSKPFQEEDLLKLLQKKLSL